MLCERLRFLVARRLARSDVLRLRSDFRRALKLAKSQSRPIDELGYGKLVQRSFLAQGGALQSLSPHRGVESLLAVQQLIAQLADREDQAAYAQVLNKVLYTICRECRMLVVADLQAESPKQTTDDRMNTGCDSPLGGTCVKPL
jgi:hypothetical protein